MFWLHRFLIISYEIFFYINIYSSVTNKISFPINFPIFQFFVFIEQYFF